jgi:ribosomal protein L40E
MATCAKCDTVNDEGSTRCRTCNAILPVKMGSKSGTRWERVRRLPELVGMKCPGCGTRNPYTSFRCASCGSLMYGGKTRSGIDRFWIFVAVAAAILAAALLLAVRAG